MSYLFFQILFCLLLAFLLGLLIGWLLRGARRSECDECEGTLATARARIADLERSLHTARTEAASAPAPVAEAPEPPAAAASAAPVGLFGAPAEEPEDDLKLISGIGAVIEKQLAGIGVTTYRQIANFTADDVERVNDAIEVFQGRIEREEWIPQAADLHRETYGTEP